MNFRLKALKEMKEDIIIKRSFVPNEILECEYELKVPLLAYNFNDINRDILEKPVIIEEVVHKKNKRFIPDQSEED